MTEEEEEKYVLEYIDSGFNENHLLCVGASSEFVAEIKSLFNKIAYELSCTTENSIAITPNFVGSLFKKYIELKKNNPYNDFMNVQSKVATLLSNKLLSSTMYAFLVKNDFDDCCRKLTEYELAELNLTEELFLPYLCKALGVKTIFTYFYSDIYTKEELCDIDSFISSSSDINEYIERINKVLGKTYEEISAIYSNFKEYAADKKSKLIQDLKSDRYDNLDNIEESVQTFNSALLFVYVYVNENENGYKSWKRKTYLYKYISMTLYFKYKLYGLYEDYIEKRALYLFFDTLNEVNAFDITQKEYIYEMAPKLRIASYLNEEYAKYKKLYSAVRLWHSLISGNKG